MVELTAFLAAVIFSLLGEIADKTQLVILSFALKYKAPFRVFFGALAGHALMDGAAIILGTYFAFSFRTDWIKFAVGILFIALGLWGFIKHYIKRKKEKEKKIIRTSPFLTTFLTLLAVEIGDKTQIASGLLAAEYKVPLTIFIGVILGLAVTIALNVFIGSKLAKHLPKKAIKIITNILFILFGIITLLS